MSAILNPVDVIKTRRQLETFSKWRAVDIGRLLWREGGVVGMWRPGLMATVSRELVYSGCTKGCYPIVRDAISDGDPTLLQRVTAASATGFIGSIGANALDLVKIRQFERPDRYVSLGGALVEIARTEGTHA